MSTKPAFLINKPLFLTVEEAKQLTELFPDTEIFSKYETPQGKTPAYYDDVEEAAEDRERYGSVWLDTGQGLYRLNPELYDGE